MEDPRVVGRTRIALLTLGMVFAVFATVVGAAEGPHPRWAVAFLKFDATAVLVALALVLLWSGQVNVRAQRWLVAALALEVLCDFFIEFWVVAGGLCSAVGMVLYACSFAQHPPIGGVGRRWFVGAALVVGLVLVFIAAATLGRPAGSSFGAPLDWAYTFYMTLLSAAVATAFVHRVPAIYRWAIVIFYVSDFFVYWGGVFGPLGLLVILNSLTYYPAQLLFAWGHKKTPGVSGGLVGGEGAN